MKTYKVALSLFVGTFIPVGLANAESTQSFRQELEHKPVFSGGRLSERYAKEVFAELKKAHKDPSSRTRSDLALLLALHRNVHPLYYYTKDKRKGWAAQMWEEARGIAANMPNTGQKSEFLSPELARAGGHFRDLYKFTRGGLGGAYNPLDSLKKVKKHVRLHEKDFLKGKKSAIGQALVKEANKLAKKNKTRIAKKDRSERKRKAYRNDPARKKLDRDWSKLNSEAQNAARSYGVSDVTNWAHSKHPGMARYKKRLSKLQKRKRRLEAKHGL